LCGCARPRRAPGCTPRSSCADFSAGVRATLASDNVCGLGSASSKEPRPPRDSTSSARRSRRGTVSHYESPPSRDLAPRLSRSAVPPSAPSGHKSGAAASPHAGGSAAPAGLPPRPFDGAVYLPLNDRSLFYEDVKYDVQLTAAALDRPASDVCFPTRVRRCAGRAQTPKPGSGGRRRLLESAQQSRREACVAGPYHTVEYAWLRQDDGATVILLVASAPGDFARDELGRLPCSTAALPRNVALRWAQAVCLPIFVAGARAAWAAEPVKNLGALAHAVPRS